MARPPLRGQRVVLDFDGPLHSYTSGWTGYEPLDPPVDGAREFCEDLVARGAVPVVCSSRADHPGGVDAIGRYLRLHGFPPMPVTNVKVAGIAYVGRWQLEFDPADPEGSFRSLLGDPPSDRSLALRARRRGPDLQITDTEWGYVGGLIDGEGCITGAVNGKGKSYLRLMLTNQHGLVLAQIREWVGAGSIHVKKPTKKNGYRFPVYQWTLGGVRMEPLLEGLLDRGALRMKEQQARLARDYLATCRYDGRRTGRIDRALQVQIIEAIQSLNQRGHARIEPITPDGSPAMPESVGCCDMHNRNCVARYDATPDHLKPIVVVPSVH